jgi:transcription antitermination factor NusA-like protein
MERGEINPLDLEIARLLVSIEDKYPSLQDVYLHKAVEADNVLAILVRRGDIPKMLSYGGKIIKFLEKKVKKSIRLLEYEADERKFLEDLFAPFSILTVNKIWLPDGTTETKVILKKKRFQLDTDAVKEIAKKVHGITLRIEFAS